MEKNICCMFSAPNPEHAIENRNFEVVASDTLSSRFERWIYRCKKCGAYVLYTYEENVIYGGWDNADIDETYCPIEAPVMKDDRFPKKIEYIKGTRSITTHYMEEDWDKEKHWVYK